MHVRPFTLALLLTSGAAAALAACSGSGTSSGCPPPTIPKGFLPQLVYPVPAASSVPDALGVVVYAATVQSTIVLFNGGTMVSSTPAPVPSPLPTPYASPSPGLTLYAVAVPTLAVSSPYTVNVTVQSNNGCGTVTRNVPFGTFFTQ